MRKLIAVTLAAALISTLSYRLGAQTRSQVSATLKVWCMSDGSMGFVGDPKP